MNVIHTEDYRRAFARYIRTGAPIRLSLKSDRPTPQYVWRTRGDWRVRPEHAANDGRLFSWDNPPATGHPGEGFGCRCEAIPYVRGETDYASHQIIGSLDSTGRKWGFPSALLHGRRSRSDAVGNRSPARHRGAVCILLRRGGSPPAIDGPDHE